MKNINESKIADEIENAIDMYYMEDNMDSVETISQLTGLGYDQVSTILDTSTQEDAMENLMSYNESKIITFEMFCEGKKEPKETEEKTIPEINREIKTIANWHSENTPKREFNINLIGKFIDNGTVKGYINRLEGNIVFIENIVEPLGLVKLTVDEAIKAYKPKKEIVKIADFSITGPNNTSEGTAPKEADSVAPKIDGKATSKAKEQKLSDKINIEGIIKFSDMK
jgi:hypothetical protein